MSIRARLPAFGYGNENGLKVVNNPFVFKAGDKIVERSNEAMMLSVGDGNVFIGAALEYGFVSEHGDSGGGIVCRNEKNEQKLIGVITQGSLFNLMYNTESLTCNYKTSFENTNFGRTRIVFKDTVYRDET